MNDGAYLTGRTTRLTAKGASTGHRMVDEIRDAAHWQSVLLRGRYVEIFERGEKEEGYRRVLEQAGGWERSEVSWAIPIEQLVVFKIEFVHRYGRFERRPGAGSSPPPTNMTSGRYLAADVVSAGLVPPHIRMSDRYQRVSSFGRKSAAICRHYAPPRHLDCKPLMPAARFSVWSGANYGSSGLTSREAGA